MKYYIFMALDKAPRLVFILIFVKFNQTANTGTAMLSIPDLKIAIFLTAI